eukprot:s2034_g9.t1
MASDPLLGKKGLGHSKLSIYYGADEYLAELQKKYELDHEIATLKSAQPDEGDPHVANAKPSNDKLLTVEKNDQNRSLKTGRLFPTPLRVMSFAVMHGVTFPVYEFQKFITHPFSDFISLPWEEFVLEHARHHASTVDLLIQGEFGWDPEEFHYALQQWAGPMGPNWYKYLLTVPWIPVIHFFGLNDTGFLFALEWWMSFPEADASGKCNKEFWTKWMPRRVKHNAVVLGLWACVWFLGTWPLGRPLSEGWRFVLPVTCAARVGFSLAWMFITNFTHSLPWNKFLENDPARTWPKLHNIMALAVGGKHRWNEMLFHDVHHCFPNAMGALSQRGRFHGWKKVHDACVEVLARGLWKPNGDEETEMMKSQKKRSALMKQGMAS